MCGIFGYIGEHNNAAETILTGLKTLEYRGYDSWGVAVKQTDGTLFIEKHVGKIGSATLPPLSSTMGIGHTRWATHGGVTQANAHPHTDCTKKVVVVHNGIVENFEELKAELVQKHHTFLSETDTEVIAHLIEELLKTIPDRKKTVMQMFQKIKGMNAVIIFFPESEECYVVKNGSPIVFGTTPHNYYIASDATALVAHTKDVYFMNDDEMMMINKKGYELFDLDGAKKELTLTKLQYNLEDVSLGKFPYFMLKEMYEQPKIIQNIIDTQQKNIADVAELIKNAYGTYFIGCGSASYACVAATYLFSKIAHRHVNASIASEFGYLKDFLKETSLVTALSQSGETIDLISSVRDAKEKGATILAITNVVGSTLYRLADYKLLLNAGPEKAVASTKAYTAKIAILYLLAHTLAGTLEQGKAELTHAVKEIRRIIEEQEKIKMLAKKIQNAQHIFVIGRGVSYATALESAIKIKEISYIHAEEFPGGELKHGPLSLVENGTPVIIYNPQDETYEDSLSSAHEVKARGGYVIGVSSRPNDSYDEYIEVENCGDATLLPSVVVAQFLGYFLCTLKGYDPDMPRNLAKSVVVK